MGFENHKTLVRRSGIILALVTFCFLVPVVHAEARKFSSWTDDVMKPTGTVRSIEGKNGEVIDCVDFHKQLAFDHPLLKNHSVEMQPDLNQMLVESENDQKIMPLQEWHDNGECPPGTIPILRAPKYAHPLKAHRNTSIESTYVPPGHEYVQVSMRGGKYFGVKAKLNVWTPATSTNEFSLAQVWVLSGEKGKLNTLEAGWMDTMGNIFTQFFIYWTSDGYQRTGCYNLECSGFVQVNRKFALGSILKPVSTYNGPQVNIEIIIFKNKESGHWWLQLDNNAIGYWPDSILTTLADGSDTINCGGEIINNREGGLHTTTDMGSGHFPSEGFGKAGYFRNIEYVDIDGVLRDPEQLIPFVTNPSCYNLLLGEDRNSSFGTHFFFGGPGYSDSSCRS